jgi:hypothetical protein
MMLSWPLLLSLSLCLAATSPLQGQTEQPEMAIGELETLRSQRNAIERSFLTDPQTAVDEAVSCAEQLVAVAQKHKGASRYVGEHGGAVSLLVAAAEVSRIRLHDPNKAITLYRRAAELTARERAGASNAFDEQIADIQYFDLHDGKAAAATLRALRPLYAEPRSRDDEMYAAVCWKLRWIDAELAFLERGERFSGALTSDEVTGALMTLYYGAGGLEHVLDPSLTSSAAPSDPSLDLSRGAEALEPSPEQIEAALSRLPPARAVFFGTYLFAMQMSESALRSWLSRNDPAGFISASLLTIAAILDAHQASGDEPTERSGFDVLVRRSSGEPTSLALLARDYAETHSIPTMDSERRSIDSSNTSP